MYSTLFWNVMDCDGLECDAFSDDTSEQTLHTTQLNSTRGVRVTTRAFDRRTAGRPNFVYAHSSLHWCFTRARESIEQLANQSNVSFSATLSACESSVHIIALHTAEALIVSCPIWSGERSALSLRSARRRQDSRSNLYSCCILEIGPARPAAEARSRLLYL